jgi:hypothetical protein
MTFTSYRHSKRFDKKRHPRKKHRIRLCLRRQVCLARAGEHYLMSELLRRSYIAALAPQGVPDADIVVCNVDGRGLRRFRSRRAGMLAAMAAGI